MLQNQQILLVDTGIFIFHFVNNVTIKLLLEVIDMRYVVDGSYKGLILGAGIVAIDTNDNVKCHSFIGYNFEGGSLMAEAYAVECAIRLILESPKQQKNMVIYLDNTSLCDMLNSNKKIKNDYVYSLKKQILLLKKYANLSLRKLTDDVKKYHNQAHKLSRSYMKNTVSVQLSELSLEKFEPVR